MESLYRIRTSSLCRVAKAESVSATTEDAGNRLSSVLDAEG